MSELFVDWDVTMRRAENWIALLPIGEQPDTALRSEVELLVKNGLLGPVYAQAAADWLAWAAAASRDAEAVLAQALVRETELGLVTALVTLEVHVYREGSNGCPTVLELVEAASLPGEEDLSNREVTTVELQSGQAVRARWRREGGRNGDVSTAIDTVCYWLPLPFAAGNGDHDRHVCRAPLRRPTCLNLRSARRLDPSRRSFPCYSVTCARS